MRICVAILRNLVNACGQTGARVDLLGIVLPEVGADIVGASFDMQIFMGSRGRERTLKEWTSLFDLVGIELKEMIGLRSFGNILVLLPKRSV
ncbi:MAG: hypothetical protein WCA45_03425 [Thiobacillaceae bacterium]